MPHVVYDNLNYELISSSTAICSDVQFTQSTIIRVDDFRVELLSNYMCPRVKPIALVNWKSKLTPEILYTVQRLWELPVHLHAMPRHPIAKTIVRK